MLYPYFGWKDTPENVSRSNFDYHPQVEMPNAIPAAFVVEETAEQVRSESPGVSYDEYSKEKGFDSENPSVATSSIRY